ncbi:MAG: hypothetical protein AAF433_14030 [Bacteroidota bacterium]
MKKLTGVLVVLSSIATITSVIISLIALNTATSVRGMSEVISSLEQEQIALRQISQDQENLLNVAFDQLRNQRRQDSLTLQMLAGQQRQISFAAQENRINESDAFWRLHDLYWSLIQKLSYVEYIVLNDSFGLDKKTEFINGVDSMLLIGLENDLLILNDSIFAEWWIFHQQCNNVSLSINQSRSGFEPFDNLLRNQQERIVTSSVEGKTKMLTADESIQEDLIQFSLYAKSFLAVGVEPIMDWSFFRSLRHRYYYGVSNLGRVDYSLESVQRILDLTSLNSEE